MRYDPALVPEGVAEEDLVIVMWDKEAGKWVELDSMVDPVSNTISAKVSHFTAFTVLAHTGPAAFVASNLRITPAQVDIGQEVAIKAVVANTGDLRGSHLVALKIDGVTVASREVTLAGRASQEVSFTITTRAAGTYQVTVDGLTGTFVVREVVPPPPVKPAAFIVSDLAISPDRVNVGETVRITVTVTNVGETGGSHEVVFMIDGKKVFSTEVTLAGGESREASFATVAEAPGTYSVTVDGLTGTFTVETVPPVKPPVKPVVNWPLIIGIVAGVVIIAVAIWLIIRRRRGA
jgi:subtilase family serine protease